MAYQSINPANGQVMESFEDISDADLEAKMAAAESCFQIWKNKGYAERAVIVAKAAALLRERAAEFAKIMTLEMENALPKRRVRSNSVRKS
jgi:succinate-semialdehyde dehydrogenase/glutarate-semialdehyde dehydrogenase